MLKEFKVGQEVMVALWGCSGTIMKYDEDTGWYLVISDHSPKSDWFCAYELEAVH